MRTLGQADADRFPVEASRSKAQPFTATATGGKTLSALQLPFFLVRPPSAYGVLTTTGRMTGKRRRRCIRAVRSGDRIYAVAIKGSARTGWVKNALATHEVRLRLPGGTISARARTIRDDERAAARAAYVDTVQPFDYLTYLNWRTGRPTAARIQTLLGSWFEEGFPIVMEIS